LALLKGRFVVASVGLEDASAGAVNAYNFSRWIATIEQSLPSDPSADGLESIIEKESASTFKGFDIVLQNGTLPRTNPLEDSKPLIDYVIAGYNNHAPAVYVVHFFIDWERQILIGPKRVVLHPSWRARPDFGLFSLGFNWAINNLANPKSYAHKRAMAVSPVETSALLAHRDLTIDQATRLVRTLIAIEKEVEPNTVGGITTVVEIPLSGDGRLVEYREEILPHKPTKK
jgi:hypothetical protein